jgi:SagB-type dehydrogenase family enzyme
VAAPTEVVPLPALATPPHEPITAVIRRRGSTRSFAHEPILGGQLGEILRRSTTAIPADVSPSAAIDPYVIVNAVEGIAAGAYVLAPERDALLRLRAGDLRREAGYLDLGQDLAADASANVYLLADLDPWLARYGNRGYRAAQLLAAIVGGRIYLAAYALGLGATGLTFFDDDVTAFFSPHARDKSVLFLVALGRPLGRARA